MASTSYFLFVSLVAIVILSSLINVLADQEEGPLAKRRRYSIKKLFNTGRLRRLYKKRGFEDQLGDGLDDALPVSDPSEELISDAKDLLDALGELEALQRLREASATHHEKRKVKQYNAWDTGMFGKRRPQEDELVRDTRDYRHLSDDYFGKRFSRDDGHPVAPAAFSAPLGWKRAFDLEDVTDEDME